MIPRFTVCGIDELAVRKVSPELRERFNKRGRKFVELGLNTHYRKVS